MNCPACGGALAPGADHCPACRARGSDRHERLFLIVACLFAAGALALPRLRRSRAFSPRGKAILGALAVGQTVLALALVAALVWKGPELYRLWWDWVVSRAERRGN